MAIAIEGTAQAGAAGNGADVTLTFDGTPAENDVVIAVGTCGVWSSETNQDAGAVTSGYTTIYQEASATSDMWCGYKVLGATPDSTFVGNGNGSVFTATAYACIVLRGVDTGTPMDATRTVNTPPTTDGSAFDGPSITTATDGAWVLSLAVDVHGTITITGAPSGYSNFVTAHGVDTQRATVALSSKAVAVAGAEDPGAYTDSGSTSNRIEVTVAVRPSGGAPPAAAPVIRRLAMTGVGR